jgi:hypothetical protein
VTSRGSSETSASNGLHGIISKKIELFITTAVRTSDPARNFIPEDRTLHNHRCENLRSYIFKKQFSLYKRIACYFFAK